MSVVFRPILRYPYSYTPVIMSTADTERQYPVTEDSVTPTLCPELLLFYIVVALHADRDGVSNILNCLLI